MSRVHLVALLLCALLPLPGFAQAPSPPPLIPAPATREEAPSGPEVNAEQPRDEIIPRERKAPAKEGGRAGRVALEILGGLVLGAVGATPGFGIMLPSFSCSTCYAKEQYTLGQLVGFAGASLGGARGVKLMGSWMGGQGLFLRALQGAGVASGIGVFLSIIVEDSPGLFVLPMVTFPLVGAIIGYEMSHGRERERQMKEAPAVTVLPAVSVHPAGGAVAGLVGRF